MAGEGSALSFNTSAAIGGPTVETPRPSSNVWRGTEEQSVRCILKGGASRERMKGHEVPTATAALAIIMLGGTALSLAQPNVQGAVELSNGTIVPQNPSLPKLSLTNTQREQIRRSVLTEHTEVEFRLKTTKPAKDFTPVFGATIHSPAPLRLFP